MGGSIVIFRIFVCTNLCERKWITQISDASRPRYSLPFIDSVTWRIYPFPVWLYIGNSKLFRDTING